MFSKIWKDPVWSAVIAAGIVALGAAVWASVKGWWPAIGEGIAQGWDWLGDSTSVTHWLLVILGLCAVAVGFVLLAAAWASFTSRGSGTAVVGWRGYTSDEFLGLKWRWRYATNGDITDVCAFCSRCDYQIRPAVQGGYFDPETMFGCDECGRRVGPLEGNYYDIESQVERKVQQRIRNGSWPGNEA